MDKQTLAHWIRHKLASTYLDPEQRSVLAVVDCRDVARVIADAAFAARFVRLRLRPSEAFECLLECFRWRRRNHVLELAETGITDKTLDPNLFYFNGRDKESHPLGICKFGALCRARGVPVEAKLQLLVLRMERLSLALPAEEQVTIILDVRDVKESEMSVDLAVQFGRLLVVYFPRIIGRLLVLQDPDRPTSIFHLLSTIMLPAEAWQLKQMSVSDLLIDVAPSELPSAFGGNGSARPSMDTPPPARHWAQATPETVNSLCAEFLRTCAENQLLADIRPEDITAPPPPSDTFASIWPPQELCFEGPANADAQMVMVITNTAACDIAFKIKTTNASRFRLRPVFGCVRACDSVEIGVTRYAIQDPKSKDKFLLQIVCLPRGHQGDQLEWLNGFWKEVPPTQVQELRLTISHYREVPSVIVQDCPGDILARIETRLQELTALQSREPQPAPPAPVHARTLVAGMLGLLAGWVLRDLVHMLLADDGYCSLAKKY